MNRQWSLATHCACAHDMSIRSIQVEVTLYLGQNRWRKPRCRIGLLTDYLLSMVRRLAWKVENSIYNDFPRSGVFLKNEVGERLEIEVETIAKSAILQEFCIVCVSVCFSYTLI